ncbi:UNVERIFIED_CONTAM: hypothetical protein FKN15_072063 [Acipenser sinensis]
MDFRNYRKTAVKPRLGGASLAAFWCLCFSLLQVLSAGAWKHQYKLSPFGARSVFGQPKWSGFGMGRLARPRGFSEPRAVVPQLVTTRTTTPPAPRVAQFDTEDAAGPVAVNLVCSPVGMEVSFPSQWGPDSVSIQTTAGNSVSFETVQDRPSSCRYRRRTQGRTMTYTFPYESCDVTQVSGPADSGCALCKLTLQCRFGCVDEISMNSSVLMVPPPLPAANQGLLRVELRIAKGRGERGRCRLYLHCSAHLCQPSDTDTCQSSCKTSRRARSVSGETPSEVTVSSGPLVFVESETESGSSHYCVSPPTRFVIGSLVMLVSVVMATVAVGFFLAPRRMNLRTAAF